MQVDQTRTVTPLKLISLATFAFILSCPLHGRASGDAWITGTVTECWEGRPKPVTNLRVYVLNMEESSKIRKVLQKIESLPSKENVVDVQAFLHLYDELVADLKSLGEPAGLVRTDKDGHFSTKHVNAKQKYLVLAIDWDGGDTDEAAYYRYEYVEPTVSRSQDVQIYMGPGKKTDCGGS